MPIFRLLLQGPNNSKTSDSIHQSNDGDAENTSARSISQDMVNTLKKKGVSINYVGKETHNGKIWFKNVYKTLMRYTVSFTTSTTDDLSCFFSDVIKLD